MSTELELTIIPCGHTAGLRWEVMSYRMHDKEGQRVYERARRRADVGTQDAVHQTVGNGLREGGTCIPGDRESQHSDEHV